MHHQKKILPVAVTLAVLAGIVLGALGFYVYFLKTGGSLQYAASDSASSDSVSSTSSSSTALSAAAAPIDTGSWQTYTNYELGFGMQYPPDITPDDSSVPGTVTFAFPPSYFSTVMKDSDSVSVAVDATCTPITSYSETGGDEPSQTIVMNGMTFTENQQYDIGAGNHHALTAYDIDQNNVCYRISFVSSGANDAGFYVSDPAQIAEINSAHAADAAHAEAVANAMIQSFTFVTTGSGENEAFYSPSATGSVSGGMSGGAIAIGTVSPIPVSVGGNLIITGTGFLATAGQNTVVSLSNGTVSGVLWGGAPQSDSSITAAVPAQICTVYIGNSGVSCPSYLVISPGVYSLTVTDQNGTTDPVYVKVQ